MYNFDEIIDRRGTSCVKYDALAEHFGRKDLIPLWVADMDFRTPDFITDELRKRLEHPVCGYPVVPDSYFPTIASWVRRLHGWEVAPDHIRYIPGIVKGIAMALHCFFPSGGGRDAAKVIIQPPVYHPFAHVPRDLGYTVVSNPLRPVYDADGFLTGYEMDFEDLRAKLSADPSIRVLILSNPHNPCGIAWDRVTLERLAQVAVEFGLLVVSDEIHAEMVLRGGAHIPFASVSEAAAEHSISFMAPSKTFNIAGIVSSYAIVSCERLRKQFFSWLDASELSYPPIFPIVATEAAYSPQGLEWRAEMLSYVQGNIDFVDAWLRENLEGVRAVKPDASFLVWLDCRRLGLGQEELVSLFVDKAGLALNDGTIFGEQGAGYMRLNVGCPRSVLQKALEKLKTAVCGC